MQIIQDLNGKPSSVYYDKKLEVGQIRTAKLSLAIALIAAHRPNWQSVTAVEIEYLN
jgi:hypothetical protein